MRSSLQPTAPSQALRPAHPAAGAGVHWRAGPGCGAIAWLPTLLAKGPQPLRAPHLRHRLQAGKQVRLHLIALDTSGSMRRRGRLALAKGHAAWLIERAARAGDDVALLCFGGQGVELRLPPGPARAAGSARVRPLGGGGGTPLTQALLQADQILERASRRNGSAETWLWLLTDGRTLEQPPTPRAARNVVVVDFDDSPRPIGRCGAWAACWGAEHRMARSPQPLLNPLPMTTASVVEPFHRDHRNRHWTLSP